MAAQIKTIGVVGTGLIGSSWAALFLAHGLRVLVSDPAPGAADKLTKYLETVWPTLEQLTSQMSFDQALANLEFVGQSLGERATDVDFIQENAPETLELKSSVIGHLDAHARPDVVIASSSSGIPSSHFISKCTVNPARVLIGHPFNPPHLMPLVEVVPHPGTDADTVQQAMAFYRSLGKHPVHIRKEVPGFVANRLQAVVCSEAYSLVTRGVVSAADLDLCMTSSLGPRWAVAGPVASNAMGGGGGPDGFRHFMRHLGPAFGAWLDNARAHELQWDSDTLETLAQTVGDQLPAGDQAAAAQAARRDRLLLQLLRLIQDDK